MSYILLYLCVKLHNLSKVGVLFVEYNTSVVHINLVVYTSLTANTGTVCRVPVALFAR